MSFVFLFHVSGTGVWSSGIIQMDNTFLLLLCAVLAISVIVISVLINAIKKNKCGYCNNKGNMLPHCITHR